VAAHDPIVSPATYPDLQPAIRALARWNGVTTLGSPAMSIFMNFLEAYEHNVFEGGLNPGEQYTGKINFGDGSLGLGTFGGLGGMATYKLLYHILHQTQGMVPCSTLCYQGDYFAGHDFQEEPPPRPGPRGVGGVGEMEVRADERDQRAPRAKQDQQEAAAEAAGARHSHYRCHEESLPAQSRRYPAPTTPG